MSVSPNSEQADRSGGNLDKPEEPNGTQPTADAPFVVAFRQLKQLRNSHQIDEPDFDKQVEALAIKHYGPSKSIPGYRLVDLGNGAYDIMAEPQYSNVPIEKILKATSGGIEHNTPDSEATPDTSSLPNLPPVDSITLDTILDSLYPPKITTHRGALGYEVIDNLGEHMAAKVNKPSKEELRELINAWHTKATTKELLEARIDELHNTVGWVYFSDQPVAVQIKNSCHQRIGELKTQLIQARKDNQQ